MDPDVDLLDSRFKDPGPAVAHSISSDVVKYARCQVVFLLDEETQFEIGMVDSFDLGIESEVIFFREGEEGKDLINRSGDCKGNVRKGYWNGSLPTDL